MDLPILKHLTDRVLGRLMAKLFSIKFVALILALLIASSFSHTYAQGGVVSDEDEADILQSLIENEIKGFGSEFGTPRTFSSENISPVSVARIKKLGFWVARPSDIEMRKRDWVVNYVVIRSIHVQRTNLNSIHLKDGIVVVRLSEVNEGRPCFAPAFSTQRSFTYEFQKTANGWVGRLVKKPSLFTFSKSLAFPR